MTPKICVDQAKNRSSKLYFKCTLEFDSISERKNRGPGPARKRPGSGTRSAAPRPVRPKLRRALRGLPARSRARSWGGGLFWDEFYSSKFVRFSISNFERSVLLCIEADLREQIRVGKRLTRSTNSTFFSRHSPFLSPFLFKSCETHLKFKCPSFFLQRFRQSFHENSSTESVDE